MTNKTSKTLALGLSTLALAISAYVQAEPSNDLFGATQESPLPKRYVVKFKNSADAEIFSAEANVSSMDYQPRTFEVFDQHRALNAVKAKEMKRIGRSNAYSVKLDNQAIKALRARTDVELVEEDMPRRLLAETTPWGQTFVGATRLADNLSGNRTVCIIDSGYDRSHPDLSGNNVTGTNNSGTGNWFDPGKNNAHGTHVAGTIAAIANGEGVVGVLPSRNVNIHVIKVFNESGWGYSSSLVSAIDNCVANGANVVSMSLGGSGSSTTERNAMAAHYNNGVLLIAAAGNAGNNTYSYPASYDSVVAVAAIDSTKKHAAFSQFTNQVELSGPGEAILSTVTRGEGRLSDIVIGGQSYFNNGIVPHNRLVKPGTDYTQAPINGTVTAPLAECSVSAGAYNCGNMNGKVCLVERVGNQGTSYPEINAAKACQTAGAAATIVYSNTALPGLQNPFVVDTNSELTKVSVSIDRATGLALRSHIGSSVTVSSEGGKDYEYYNGTSMATPHVSGVATLVWSHHPQCRAAQVRAALRATAEDLDVVGRDDKTGYGLVNAVAAKVYLDASCDGPGNGGGSADAVLTNGVAKTNLSGATGDERHFYIDVPAGATNLKFTMSGGSGNADLYVQYGAAPTTSSYDCRSRKSGNGESCPISSTRQGTYYAMVKGNKAFSGASLVASYATGGSGGSTGAVTYTNTNNYNIPDNSTAGISSPIAASRNADSGTVSVKVNIVHTDIGDLDVQLIAPNGKVFVLHDNTGAGTANINKTYSVNAAGVPSKGTWNLKAIDSARIDSGYIDAWELTFK